MELFAASHFLRFAPGSRATRKYPNYFLFVDHPARIACSSQSIPAIHRKTLPGDEARGVACEEGNYFGNILSAAHSLHRDIRGVAVQFFLSRVRVSLGRYPAGRDKINGNASGRQLARPGASQAQLGALG